MSEVFVCSSVRESMAFGVWGISAKLHCYVPRQASGQKWIILLPLLTKAQKLFFFNMSVHLVRYLSIFQFLLSSIKRFLTDSQNQLFASSDNNALFTTDKQMKTSCSLIDSEQLLGSLFLLNKNCLPFFCPH